MRKSLLERITILKRLSQASPTTTDSATTTVPTTSTTPVVVVPVDIRSLPGFNSNLFQLRPNIINVLNTIANLVNAGQTQLSNGKTTFDITWKNPSISGSQFTGDLKNLTDIAKWLYTIIIQTHVAFYSLEGLTQFANDLMNFVKSKAFTDSDLQYKIVNQAQLIISFINA